MTLFDAIAALFLSRPAPALAEGRARIQGIATVFHAYEPGFNNGKLACSRWAGRVLGHSRHIDELPIVATRYRPACGTFVRIVNVRTGQSAVAVRAETGPYGCEFADGYRVVGNGQCQENGGRRLVDVDLSVAACDAIGCDGYDPVRLYWQDGDIAENRYQLAARTGSWAWFDTPRANGQSKTRGASNTRNRR